MTHVPHHAHDAGRTPVRHGQRLPDRILAREKGAGFREVGTVGWKSEALKYCDYAPG